MTDSHYTALLIVLDRSGSMESIRDDMVGGLESMLREQAAKPGKLTIDLVMFDDRIDHTAKLAVPATVVVDLQPRGMTALNDAMTYAIRSFGESLAGLAEGERPANVQVVVVTDGLENASREATAESVKELVRRQADDYDWDFIYLGADQDAVLTADQYGIRADKAMSYARGSHNVDAMVSAMSAQVSAARMADASVGFSDAERVSAMAMPPEAK